jgi:hypothetical protein
MIILRIIDTVPERNLRGISMERRNLYQLYVKFSKVYSFAITYMNIINGGNDEG